MRPAPAPAPPRLRDYGIAALLLTALADALFFDRLGRSVGLSAPLFAALLALAGVVIHRRRLRARVVAFALFLAIALLALVEAVEARSVVLAVACLGGFVLAAAGRMPAGLAAPVALGSFLITAPLALGDDGRRLVSARRRSARRGPARPKAARIWLVWVMPVCLALGFAVLLVAGNPLLQRWIASIDPLRFPRLLDPMRILFWLPAAGLSWAFLRPRPRVATAPRAAGEGSGTEARPAQPTLLFGPAAILRALVLFNAVFAVQTLLDAAYLWGGLQLPEGLSYAEYAHRGTYLLMAAALLAAAFVLLALRPGGAAATDRRIRALVYLWIGQNVVLVLSAMLRLDLYVDAYALTHLRLAAFAWMGVVAAGLALICLRIALGRSNRWLVGANLAVVALVFAGSCFLDDDALIARFNVAHSRETSGAGASLDVEHLASLGPAAVPAIDDFLKRAGAGGPLPAGSFRDRTASELRVLRNYLAWCHAQRSEDWRGWTFRDWRLSRYLEANAAPIPPMPAERALPPFRGPNR